MLPTLLLATADSEYGTCFIQERVFQYTDMFIPMNTTSKSYKYCWYKDYRRDINAEIPLKGK
jgi:hypothetical protein